ncbi:hypothetical protein GCK72_004743 [Caenorhabditis remanei]|uniref:Uncharacterized protein n=1 Tax=Caenorhabditis remanei TaxID=31234 RepID=A0A6A5HEI4_CAERE|nr:hypothetical protein GCK72_004743 [Caenorhabditis remanei]KAF1764793.1 hypothetical protein GCK72_004743 [Caenorhabditis remanei]
MAPPDLDEEALLDENPDENDPLLVLNGQRQDPPENHLDEREEEERIERWQMVEMMADGVEIQEEGGGGDVRELEDEDVRHEEEEEDIDWVTPLTRKYSKPFSKCRRCG